jgi:fimbrial isopeptide formation D2 family protein
MKPLYILVSLLVANACVYSQQSPPVLEWKKCFGGTGNDMANAIIKTNDGGYIIAGSSASNDGDVTGHHGSADSLDAWVVKISSAGNIQWQRSYGGSGVESFEKIIALSDGGYLCYGSTSSNDGDVAGNHGMKDLWVVKINQSGQLLWQKCLGGTRDEFTGSIRQNSDGSYWMIGTTASGDGDVTGNVPYQGILYKNIWIAKLAADGSIMQERSIGGVSGDDFGYDIVETAEGGYVMAAFLTTHEEVFPYAGTEPYGVVLKVRAPFFSSPDWMAMYEGMEPVSITPTGDRYMATYRARNCGGAKTNYRTIVHLYENTAVFVASPPTQAASVFGSCITTPNWLGYHVQGSNGHAELDAVHGYVTVGTYDTVAGASTPHGDYDGFLGGYTANGNTNWRKYIGGSGKEYLTGIAALAQNEFIVAGYTNSNDDDVSGNHGGFDIWIVKFGSGNQVKGTVFADLNSNGSKEANEPFVNNLRVETAKGNNVSTSLTTAGQFRNDVDSGGYVTRVINNNPYYTAVPATRNSSFSGYDNTDSFSFAMQPAAGKKDYQAEIFPITPARPGMQVTYHIRYANIGTETLANGTFTLIKDHRLNFTGASPVHTSIDGDTVRWTVSNLLPFNAQTISVNFTAAVPPEISNNDTLISQVHIDSTGDLTPLNNVSELRQRVTGAYDPNDKQEAHGGFLLPGEYAAGKSLLYTVRFQNTGNDTAFLVVIRDTLDSNLDWSSFEMVGSSHNHSITITNGNIITWTFANILLPDSNVNEPMSHGYVTFRIKPKAGLAIGNQISNSASIYFDFNLPVKTNTSVTTIKAEPPALPVITGLQNNYCSLMGVQTVKITNLPANGSGITVSVKIGGITVPVAADSTFSFNVSTLAPGPYTITVEYSNGTDKKNTASIFTITEAVDPDVNVSANITTITNLTTNVIITAVNAAGGGPTPLYTFARDRNFTNISQPESVNNTWTFNPSILAIGDNKIYVRMKTGATCVTMNTVVDSILLVRSSVTGITDPDMPGQVINIYPNPFKDVITINGLSTSKTYTITLFNLEGKQLASKRVSGRSSIVLTRQQQATGIYWLSIYDEKSRQLLGTVKMLKE